MNHLQELPSASADDQDTESDEGNAQAKQTAAIRLCIEQALHIALPVTSKGLRSLALPTAEQTAPGHGSQTLVRVAYQWQGVASTTPAVVLSEASSARWQYIRQLPMAEAESVPGVSSSSEAEEEGQVLQLQVLGLLFSLGCEPCIYNVDVLL